MRFNNESELGSKQCRAYLASISEGLTANVKAFALQDWYYDPNDHRCPHDSWLEQLTVDESAKGERKEKRCIAIRLRLLAPYHDGEILFTYENVRRYDFDALADFKSPPYGVGHGDFLQDEIRLLHDGLIEHQIAFSRSSTFVIECADIGFEVFKKSK